MVFRVLTECPQRVPRKIGISHWLSFAGFVANLVITSPAYPWGSKGHEIVAAIAETHLTDTARQRIKELLPQGTTLAEASTWPDKAGRQIPDMDPYHFINSRKKRTHTISSGIANCATASSKLSPGIFRS